VGSQAIEQIDFLVRTDYYQWPVEEQRSQTGCLAEGCD
jgi:hypothetical protein